MIKWYGFVLVYFVSGVILLLVNKLHRIIPPQTNNGWIILVFTLKFLVMAWWIILKPYLDLEWSVDQANQLFYAVLLEFPMTHILFKQFLPKD